MILFCRLCEIRGVEFCLPRDQCSWKPVYDDAYQWDVDKQFIYMVMLFNEMDETKKVKRCERGLRIWRYSCLIIRSVAVHVLVSVDKHDSKQKVWHDMPEKKNL